LDRFLTDPRVEKLVQTGKISLNYDFLKDKSFIEKFLFIGFKIPNCSWLGYPISGLMIWAIFLLYSTSVGLGTSEWSYFSITNYFFVRDSLLAVLMPPLYMLIIKKLKELPLLIKQDLDIKEQDFKQFFSDFFHRFNNIIGMVISAISLSATYLGIIISYIVKDVYTLHFFLFRLIGVLGLFFTGAVVYQALVALRWFVFEVNSKLELHLSSLYNGLKPVGELASTSVFVYMFGVAITLLPVAFYGYNPKHLIWYIIFQGVLFAFGFVLFFCIMLGFHRKMLSTKSKFLYSISLLLNTAPEIKSIVKIKHKTSAKKMADKIDTINPLIELIDLISNTKEWPSGLRTLFDLVLSYILPTILSILSLL